MTTRSHLPYDVILLTLQYSDLATQLNASLVNHEWYQAAQHDLLWKPHIQRTHSISNAQIKLIKPHTFRQYYIKIKKQRISDSKKREKRNKLIQFRYRQSRTVHSSFAWLLAISFIILSLRDILYFRTRDAFVPLWLLLISIWAYWAYIIMENIIFSERKNYAIPITSGIVASLVSALIIMVYYRISRNMLSWFIVLFPIYSSSFSFSAILLTLWRDRNGDTTFLHLALCFTCIAFSCFSFSMFYKRTGMFILTVGNVSAIRACKKTSFKNYDVLVMEFFISLIICQLSVYIGMDVTSLVWITGVVPIYFAHKIFLETTTT
jgi:hypothetical protein